MPIRPLALAVAAVAALSACSGETASQSSGVTVTISPPSAALLVGATATFTATVSGAPRGGGALLVPRMAHAAVLLPNGEVLVTGGPGTPGIRRARRSSSTRRPGRPRPARS